MSQSLYIGHGAPLNAIWQTDYRKNLERFGSSADRPEAIVVVSAHFERNIPLQITSAAQPGIIYDYYGFPEEMYQLEYNAPGHPELAGQLAATLEQANRSPTLNPDQGLDHGAWIPLKVMYPEADIPVLQLSIPIPRSPEELYRIGEILAPYRGQGVMFMGSGNLVHNLPHAFRKMRQLGQGLDGFRKLPTERWAKEVDSWVREKLDEQNHDDLLAAPQKLDRFSTAAPTTEHFDPLYFVLGTLAPSEGVSYIHEGFEGGSISMRSFVSEV